MTPLNLRPIPITRLDPSRESRVVECDGFVDDAVILSLLMGPVIQPTLAPGRDLLLTADEMDFAGWRLNSRLPTRATQAPARRAGPPVLEETGIGRAHTGAHRWWLAGVVGTFSTMLIALLLFSLGNRNTKEMDELSISKSPVRSLSQSAPNETPVKKSRELTGTSTER
jgi:hypothetical protein